MKYNIKKLSELSGVSARTLRWYEEVGLLAPSREKDNQYRVYTEKDVDRLQDILFYKELGLSLDEIGEVLKIAQDRIPFLQSYKEQLVSKKQKLERLILSVDKTIKSEKGQCIMSINEKFEAFKDELIAKNEEEYGKEARETYGNDAVDGSNALLKSMGEEKFAEMQALGDEINALLKSAIETGASAYSVTGETIAKKHKKWLKFTWKTYSPEAHTGLAQTYVDDSRFCEFYETNAAQGAAQFLRDAIVAHVNNI